MKEKQSRQKKENKEGKEKEGRLECPQSTAPEQCINISHTHTQNKWLIAHTAQLKGSEAEKNIQDTKQDFLSIN